MSDLLQQLAFAVGGVGLMAVIWWAADRIESRKTPEQRKADERWDWRRGR